MKIMTKIDIFSGFLGAGKTTLIKKLIGEAYKGEQIVLIENEFGEIGIDGGFLQDAGIQINEMNQGCICCSLVGDFERALEKVMEEFTPERILIEPSGVGKLSDIITAVEGLEMEDVVLNGFTTVVDAKKAKMYMKNFGEFFNNQVEHASSIILSHTKGLSQEKLDETVAVLKEHNGTATIIATDWDELDGKQILEAMENKDTLAAELERLEEEHEHHHHHHDHECDDPDCECHHHDHDHDDDEHEHHHHHHDHDHECDDPDCECHHHHGHHHHHADDVFASVGEETTHKFTMQQIENALNELDHEEEYGIILRAKGIVEGEDGKWIHFDYVPGEPDVRTGSAGIIGRLCVIGADIKEDKIKELFNI